MDRRKVLLVLIAFILLVGMTPISALAVDQTDAKRGFSDMPNDWSTAALQHAVDNGLLVGANGKLNPKGNLTRAEMATIITRAFNAQVAKNVAAFSDVKTGEWYADYLAKAYQMQVIQGANGLMKPMDAITRQEAFVIIARALKLADADQFNGNFSDVGSLAVWAKGGVAALANAGYIQGAGGKINPTANITRAEFAQVMKNVIAHYINKAGTYTDNYSGNVMINVADVTLKNSKVTGDVILGDGVGDGDVTLEDVTISGKLILRGGGANSIVIKGDSNIGTIIIARIDGEIRVIAEDGVKIEVIIIDDGSDDVILEGEFGTVTVVAEGIKLDTTKATVAKIVDETGTVEVVDAPKPPAPPAVVDDDDDDEPGGGPVGPVEPEPEVSVYGFEVGESPSVTVSELPKGAEEPCSDSITIDGLTPLSVNLSATTVNQLGYDWARILVEVTEGDAGNIQAWAQANSVTDNNWYNVLLTGWGGTSEVSKSSLASDEDTTLDIYLFANKAGDYTVKFTAVEWSAEGQVAGEPIASGEVSFTVFAENVVAVIGTTQYEDLGEALIEAEADETVMLLKNVDLDDNTFFVLNKKITINGNDKVVTGKTTTDYANGLFTFGAGSEGSTLKNLTIKFTSTGAQTAAVYFTYGFTGGSSSTVTTIENVVFNGASDLSSIGQEMAISSTYMNGGYVDIKDSSFTNFKYAMYFNQISNANITGNTIDGTNYNGIMLAGDNEGYSCDDVVITNNTLSNISYKNYANDLYAAGITIGLHTSNVTVDNNNISMLNGKPYVYYVAGAKIADSYYESFAAALAAANDGDTVTLLKNVDLDDNIFFVLNKKITIDGNDKVVTGKTTTDYANGLFTFGAGSEGSTLKNLTIKFTSTGAQTAAVYFTYGFTGGSSSTVTTIENVVFNGASDLSSIGQEMAISSTYMNGGYVDIKDSSFTNFKYAMYFNQISNVNITGNTIDGTNYNGINIAADNVDYPCVNITITGNTLSNISEKNYENDLYAAGITIGLHTSNVTVENNSITMLNSKPEMYDAATELKAKFEAALANQPVDGVNQGSEPFDFDNDLTHFGLSYDVEVVNGEVTIYITGTVDSQKIILGASPYNVEGPWGNLHIADKDQNVGDLALAFYLKYDDGKYYKVAKNFGKVHLNESKNAITELNKTGVTEVYKYNSNTFGYVGFEDFTVDVTGVALSLN